MTYRIQIIHANVNDSQHGRVNQTLNIIALGAKLMDHIIRLHEIIGVLIMGMTTSVLGNISGTVNQEKIAQILMKIPSD